MKGLMILAKGFEDTEALTTLDILRRAGLHVDTAGIHDECIITSQSGVVLQSDITIKGDEYLEYDFLIVPGGKAVFEVLDKLSYVDEIITHFVTSSKLSSFICAAPHLPGKIGLLHNHKYTCFPECNADIKEGTYCPAESVITSGNIITARSMAYSIDFALAIIDYLLGKNQKENVLKSIQGIK